MACIYYDVSKCVNLAGVSSHLKQVTGGGGKEKNMGANSFDIFCPLVCSTVLPCHIFYIF